ncbi:MAG TPA: DUF4440 domain-containing protein [Allosphingosinicella sp.]
MTIAAAMSLIASCAHQQGDIAAAAAAGEPQRQERELMEADRRFAADAAERGVARAFAGRMHPEGKLISPDREIAVGPAGVAAALADDRSQWTWEPREAAVSGDLGVTWGEATIRWRNADGLPQQVRTRYTTVWRRDAAGRWLIWLDIGNQAPVNR